jgi:hypothetical protein
VGAASAVVFLFLILLNRVAPSEAPSKKLDEASLPRQQKRMQFSGAQFVRDLKALGEQLFRSSSSSARTAAARRP